ncbi:SDR family NAD(P)-dependent oxidoreductase [Methylobacterium phyllosphaerae]
MSDDGRIGILINDAGANVGGAFAAPSPDDIARLVTLNATSVMRRARAVAPRFAAAGEGAIVNIGSVVGLIPAFDAPLPRDPKCRRAGDSVPPWPDIPRRSRE